MSEIIKKALPAVLAAISLVLILFVAACTTQEEPSPSPTLMPPPPTPTPPPRIYIALGDSVSSGFGVQSDENYTSILFETLQSEGLADEYYNYSVDGYTTSALLGFLKNADNLKQFQNATVITLNIGGNNILVPILENIPDVDELVYAITELVAFLSEYSETMSEAAAFTSETRELLDGFTISDVPELIPILQGTLPMLEDVDDMLSRASELEILKLTPILTGSNWAEVDGELQKSVVTFSAEFTEIIELIKNAAPNATIIVNTVYNPVPTGSMEMMTQLHHQTDGLVVSINDIIHNEKERNGYLVADVYSSFAAQPSVADIMNYGLDMSAMTLNFDIVHPNSAGHKIIAELNHNTLMAE